MKTINLLAAATALVMAATPAFAANWVLVDATATYTVLYYDADTIQRSRNQVTVLEKWDYSRDKTEKLRQWTAQKIYDCAKRTFTFLKSTIYYPDGTTNSFNFKTYEQEAGPFVPDAMGEAMLKAVCR